MNRSLLLCIPSVYARQCVFLTVHLMAALSEFVCALCRVYAEQYVVSPVCVF